MRASGARGDGVTGEWDGEQVAFGETGARLTYGSYLRLEDLLSAQRPESDPPAHDELLFITIHQVYELWFQLLLHEATAARDAMLAAAGPANRTGANRTGGNRSGARRDGLWWAQHLLERMHVVERVLVQQVDVLETMTPQDFLQFRQALAPASGFQSVQFRELEFLSGAKDPSFVERFRGLTDAERARLHRRLAEPTLWEAFLAVLAGRGLPVGDDEQVVGSLRRAAHDRSTYGDVWALAEALLEHDELAAGWRARHVVMVERMIGARTGTGGSSGAGYLRSRLDLRYYPLLWELRSVL
ncbi:MAG TPA: tryptophan 2,3-dioxygenase family protein [Nocardioidaceae bacterium]|nr:tryptophan 2,3-dioxygenase family protein [Nocardioidaceae bacterium]